jgi:tetratricopeptide (TPR) repeat protein
MVDEQILTEVRNALAQGQRARARDLLTRLLRRDPNQPEYWLWMSAAVETPKERLYCLREVLRLDPDNIDARRGLILMGALPRDERLVIPAALQRRAWQVDLEKPRDEATRHLWRRIALYGGLVVLVVALVTAGIFSVNRLRQRAQPTRAVISFQPLPTATPMPQVQTAATPNPAFTPTITPPWAALEATYTPTPAYGRTPHPIIEAYSLGVRAFERGDFNRAIQYLDQAAQIQPAADIYTLIGQIYLQQGAYTQALEAFNAALKADKNYAPAYLGRARALLGANPEQAAEAARNLQEALRLDPNLAEAHLELAALAATQGDDTAAADHLEQAAGLLPESPLVAYYRAWIALRQDDLETALAQAQEALRRDVTLLPAYRLLGQIYLLQDRPTQAIPPLEVYLTYGPAASDTEVLGWLAQAYARQGRAEQALAMLDRALAADRLNLALWLQRGEVNLQAKDYEAALDDFKQALNLNPRSFTASLGRGRALLGLEAYGDAYMQLSKAEGLARDEADKAAVYYWRAQAVEPLDPRAAYADWQRLLALPDDAVPAAWRTQAQQALARLATPTPTPLRSPTPSGTPPTLTPTRAVTAAR